MQNIFMEIELNSQEGDLMKGMKPEDRILEAALNVVEKNTISGTRMHLIAAEGNMVQSNLHYYFKTKEELLLRLQDKVLMKCLELRDKDREKAEDTLQSQLNIFFHQKQQFLLDYRQYDFAEVDFWVQARTNDKIKQVFIQSFSGWRKEISVLLEKYCPELEDEKKNMIPAVVVSLLEGATMQYLIDEDSFSLQQYMEFCEKQILNMIESK